MLILSLDSTARTAAVALSDDYNLLAVTTLNVGNKHSTTLLPAVKFVLEQAGRRVTDVELFAITAGPGSYTGVRIGAGTVKGLALGRLVPCIGVSSLEVLAASFTLADGIVCPLINARNDRYFTALFSAENGAVSRLSADDVLEGAEIERLLSENGRTVYLAGDGAEAYLTKHTSENTVLAAETMRYPNAYYAGVAAKRIYDAASDTERADFTADALRPIYLRRPQAERELLKIKE